jgi:hypothetical protein
MLRSAGFSFGRLGLVVLDFILPDSFHESCLRSSLDRRTDKREVLWCTEVADKLRQITYVVSINLLHRVRYFESAFV